MLVAVTGATGKIGRSLVRELLHRGHRVRAMVRITREGHWGNTQLAVDELRQWGAEIVPADFSDDDSMKHFVAGAHVLVHNGYHHVNEGQHPVEWTQLNILGTVKLYDAFWRANGTQIIFISSSVVYGRGPKFEEERFDSAQLPLDERTGRAPLGLYAVYKSCIEDTTATFKHDHGMKSSSTLRPVSAGVGSLLGFRCYDDKGALVNEVRRLLQGEEVVLEMPEKIVAIDGHDFGVGCDLLIRKGLLNADIFDWYVFGNTPVTPNEFVEIFRDVLGPVKLSIKPVPQARWQSDRLITDLGYQAGGSAATLRRHLIEIVKRTP